jgi:four helix bundle protein
MAQETAKGLESLQLWQRAIEFAEKILKEILPLMPSEEKWSLTHQIRRSAQSIPANIAEGYGRYYYQEGVRFCYIARGSLEETFSHLNLAFRLGYLSEDMHKTLLADVNELRRLLSGYIAFLKRNRRGESEPGAAVREGPGEYIINPYLDDEPIIDDPNH